MGRKPHYCGFCGKSDDEVDRMLAGPCIEVCNECIDMMHKMVHEPKPILPVKSPAKSRTVIPFRTR
jgi:ATP-dependent Clp protease ATP-binding subunit ClpX